MELQQLKAHSLGLLNPIFAKIVAFVDYGDVNFWYDKDQRDWKGNTLPENHKLIVDIEKLSRFTSSFCSEKRFYYGWNPRKMGNWHIVIKAERYGFVKSTN